MKKISRKAVLAALKFLVLLVLLLYVCNWAWGRGWHLLAILCGVGLLILSGFEIPNWFE